MSKRLIVFTVLLILFSGINWADDLWLEIGHRSSSWNAGMAGKRFLINSGSNWTEEYLINAAIQTSSIQQYMAIHYSPLSWFTANVTAGVSKTTLVFDDIKIIEETNYTWNGAFYSQSGSRPTDFPVETSGEINFFYGAGVELIPYQIKNFGVSLQANYSQQTASEKFRIYDFTSSIRIDPYDPEIWHYGRYVEAKKAAIKEVEIKLNISGSTGKFNFSGGPMILLAKIDFSGSTCTTYGFENHFDPEMRPRIRKEHEFEFNVKNKDLFSIFARMGFQATETTELFAQFSTGANNAFTAGIKINL